MFHCGWSIGPKSGFCDTISWYVAGISCISPRAPTQLREVGSSRLSANPCALNHRQSNEGPKYCLLYLAKTSSYRELILRATIAEAAFSILDSRPPGLGVSAAAVAGGPCPQSIRAATMNTAAMTIAL